ncbi:snRNA-activating protein complex subunit 4 isoform 4-T4 [Lycaon pictus]
MDVDAEREKIAKEIAELERILDPSSSSIGVGVSESGLALDSDADSLPEEDSDAADSPVSEEERWGEASNGEDDPKEKNLPEDPETCLQLNMVYQEVIQERLAEVSLLLAQNREQQEEIMSDLAGSKGPKVKDGKSLPPNLYIGHFMKPYFKDRVTGVGPPANEETREKAAQGIKAFEELLVTKWKNWEKALLRRSVVSDRLQRLLQPKLLKLEYLHQKQSRVTSEAERQVLEKQSREAETEAQDIRQLPEEALLGNRLDNHDWEKISNVNFEGSRSAEEIRKFWQNFEHPSINKQEWSGQEVDQLKAIAAKHGHLQWQTIAKELGTNRSAFQCLQKYQQHNKALKRKEWTREEDRLLTQLVQEMRVGSHIPYRRIVYYMEGRDSMQLIYRWTKSLDPSLKKGFWAPEEDAKLLQAVAKYGEQDWFKIREEVPGRSDAQCRDRYLRRLHFSLKKGRWNASEEEKLVELIEKYGVGHWAKIASELPHRTGSQCLSKWKIMVREKLRQSCLLSSSLGASPGDSSVARPRVQQLWHRTTRNRRRWRGQALQRRLLEYQLLMAMSSWVGDVLPCTSRRPATVHTQADGLRKQLQDAQLTSTPVFTLFIQLFQIDTTGCMEVVRERKAQSSALLQTSAQDPGPGLLQMSSSTQNATGRSFCSLPSREPAKQSTSHKGSRGWQPCRAKSSPQAPLPAPSGPRPKPKTVSELLREKRLREARAQKATEGTVALTPLLLSSPLILQPSLPQTPHHPSTSGLAVTDMVLSGPGAPAVTGLRTSAKDERPSTLPVVACTLASTEAVPAASRAPVLGPSQVSVNGHQDGLGQSQAPATSRKQGLPEAPLFLPAAPSPTQLPVQPLSLTPALGMHKEGPHVVATTPLPVTWVLTAQGLLSVPAVVGLRGPAGGTSDPKGLSVTLSPTLPGMQVGRDPRPSGLSHPWQPPANVDTDSDPASRTDLLTIPMLCQSQNSVEMGGDVAHASGGPAFPGEAQVVQEIAMPRIPSQATLLADHPEAKPCRSSQPPMQAESGPGETPGSPRPGGLPGPLGLERPPPPRPRPERGALDLDLLSQESEAAVQEWLRGKQGVCVPPLGSRLPYQPPALCSLRALSGLLLHKKTLEQRATSLMPSGAAGALQASLGQVRRQLQDSPAYLLLKARFLAAFTLPALLATLSPHGVPTTLSVATRADPESEDDLGELELTCGPQAGPAATIPVQGAPDPGQSLDGCDSLDVRRTRHAWHARKRQRLV